MLLFIFVTNYLGLFIIWLLIVVLSQFHQVDGQLNEIPKYLADDIFIRYFKL